MPPRECKENLLQTSLEWQQETITCLLNSMHWGSILFNTILLFIKKDVEGPIIDIECRNNISES